jgi:hypothetical protein
VPYVENEFGSRVRAYFSAGLVAVRREAGVFRAWEDNLRRLVGGGIVPEGAMPRMDEIALVATVALRYARTRLLDARYNYLIYRRAMMIPALRMLPLNELVHIHYRSAFDEPGFLRSVQPPLDEEGGVLLWLEQYLPLRPIVEAAEDVFGIPV